MCYDGRYTRTGTRIRLHERRSVRRSRGSVERPAPGRLATTPPQPTRDSREPRSMQLCTTNEHERSNKHKRGVSCRS